MKIKKLEGQFDVKSCRACGSYNIVSLGLVKNYYLQALEIIAKVAYSGCANCGLIFQAKYFGDEWLKDYYEQSPMLRRVESTSYEHDQYERQSAFIKRYRNINQFKVLEIGAGSGGFLKHLHSNYGCKVYFDEYSDEATHVLFDQGGLSEDTLEEKNYDLIVLRHVLEHINDIQRFLNTIHSKISKNGILFLEVPDWSFFDEETDPLIFEHLSQFTLKSLMAFFTNNFWSVVAFENSICRNDPATPNRVLRLMASPPKDKYNLGYDLNRRFKDHYIPINDSLKKDILEIFDKYPGKIALYPASHLSFSMILENNVPTDRLIGLFDIDKKKQGEKFLDFLIYPPEKLLDFQPEFILITTMAYEDEIKDYLSTLPIVSNFLSLKDLTKHPIE